MRGNGKLLKVGDFCYFRLGDLTNAKKYVALAATVFEPQLKDGMSGVEQVYAEHRKPSEKIESSLKDLFQAIQ